MNSSLRFSWRNLTPQLVAIVILPLAAFTLIVALGGLLLHQDSMRTMVGERDARAVRAASATLAEELIHRFDVINILFEVVKDDLKDGNALPTSLQTSLSAGDFDRGVGIITEPGQILMHTGDVSLWESLVIQGVPDLHTVYINGTPINYHITPDPQTSEYVFYIVSAESVNGMYLIGAHSLDDLIDQVLGEVVSSSNSGIAFVVTPQMELLYRTGDTDPVSLSEHPGVSMALDGGSGSTYYDVGRDERVVAFSAVSPFGWAMVIEESWEAVANPLLRTTEVAPLLVVPILFLAMLAIWFGTRYVVQPLQKLEGRASELAWGDYEAIEQSVGGIAEIQHLQSALVHLAYKVKSAQQGLRSYIGAITMGQEDERRRLARELHDDTLQSLIALNQRIQLAELDSDDNSDLQNYAEIRSLTEDTIQNLRRITRALRPVYLEDLGLSAALEMLAHEIEAIANISVRFLKKGSERRLPGSVELTLYRIAQEALNNVVRHASASEAVLNIEFHAGHVLLEVSDNGRGFEVPENPAELVPDGHYGMLGLHERAELVGASLEIRSSKGLGTIVRVDLPALFIDEIS